MQRLRVLVLGALIATAAASVSVSHPGPSVGAAPSGDRIELQVTGRHGVPADARAVALNVTVTDARAAGFVTVWPCGDPMPEASNVNFVAGRTIPNLVVSRVGSGGTVCLEASARVELIVDHAGYVPAGSDFTPTAVPVRLMDTRRSEPTTRIGAGEFVELQVGGRSSIPDDAAAVVMNVTAVDPASAGFVTVWPCGTSRPDASNLNFAAGQTIANLVISRAGADGRVCLYSFAEVDLIADVSGYFPTGSSYRSLMPIRMLETRIGGATFDGRLAGVGPVAADTTFRLPIVGRGQVDVDAAVVVMNVTVADSRAPGFLTVFPCDSTPPATSNLNFSTGDTVPNLVISRLSASGEVCLSTTGATDLIVDVSGVFPADGDLVAPTRAGRLLDTRSNSAADGPLTPYVVCVDEVFAVAWFGYVNGSERPVAVPDGPRNRLSGADPDRAPRAPVLFGTGTVEPAFSALFPPQHGGAQTDGTSPPSITWTLVGPDGVERSAVASPDDPVCEPDRIAIDDRTVGIGLVDVTQSGDEVEVRVEIAGDTDTSACAAGLRALPPLMWIGASDDAPRLGAAASFGVTLGSADPPTARLSLSAWLLDRCEFEGFVSGSWPIPTAVRPELARAEWCVVSTPSGPQVQQDQQGEPWDCPEDPVTGPGGWSRPG